MLWAQAAALALFTVAAPGPQQRVSVVSASPDDPLVTALIDELGTLGFSGEVVPGPAGEPSWEEIRAIAKREHVAAAIWMSPDRTELIIWVDDRDKGRAIVRTLPSVSGEDSDQVLALRAVELLRASLREVDTAPAEPGPPNPTPPPPQPEKPRPPPRLFVDIGPAAAIAAGGVGVSAHIALGIRYMPHPRIGLRLAALAPTIGRTVDDTEGSARITVAQVLVGPHVALRRPSAVFQPDLGAGVGLSIVRMDGRAQTPYQTQTDHVLGTALRFGVGFAAVLHARVRLRVDVAIGAALPTPRVAFAGREVAAWGQPHGVGAVALEFPFLRRPRGPAGNE